MNDKVVASIAALVGLLLVPAANAATTWSAQNYCLYAGDFADSGHDGILYVSKDGSEPSGIVLADSSGQLTIPLQSMPSNYLGIPWSCNQFNVFVADFNGDGHADILLQTKTSGDSYLLFSNAQGQIASISQTIPEDVAGVAFSADQHQIVVGDFNGDHKADLFLRATSPAGMSAVILADSNGEFTATSSAQSWNDGYLGLNWASTEAKVYAGDFNGDGYADLLVQAKPKWVIINYTIPFPVPTYPPNMNGVVLAAAGGGLFQAAGVQAWSRTSDGLDWSPLSSHIVVGKFDTSRCAACDDVILQGNNSGNASDLVLGNSSGAVFSTGTVLASDVNWSADSYNLIAGDFGTGGVTGIYFQATSASGTNYVADSVNGGAVAQSGNDLPEISFTYDALGRLVAFQEQNGASITYTLDPAGNRTQVTTTAGSTMSSVVLPQQR